MSNTKELTYGNPLKLILIFMFPMFLGNLFQQLYNFTDALIVSRVIGIKTLAAVGTTAPLIFLVISFIFASTQGFTIILAQRFGAKDYMGVKKSLAASIILSGIMTAFITILSTPFSKIFLTWLQTPSDIIQDAIKYLVIMFVGIFATIYYNLSSNVIRALGNSKTPLYFLVASVILNIFFDILFVVKFRFGIEGAAWATVLSQAISTVICVSYMFLKFPILHLKKDDFKLSKEFLFEHIRYGIPMGLQMSILTLGMIAVQYVINSYGSTTVAAYTTAMRVDQMFSQTFIALGATMSVFTAQNYGAKKMSRIKQGTKAAVLIALIISAFSFTVLKIFGKNIISLFMTESNPEVLRLGLTYLNIIIIFFIFLGLLMIFRNILQGLGDVISPLISGFAELIARTVFAFSFGYYFGFIGVCSATPSAWISGALVLYISYKINLKRFSERKLKMQKDPL